MKKDCRRIVYSYYGEITFERTGISFCCEHHKQCWEEERYDLFNLSILQYRKKYGRDLLEAFKAYEEFQDAVMQRLKVQPIIKYAYRPSKDIQVDIND